MHAHSSSLLTEIGIDAAEIINRQAFLTFDQRDATLLKSLHNILKHQQEEIVEAFYAHLQKFPEMHPLLGDETKQARLKHTQAIYFSQLTEGCYDQSYVENRLHVGVVHQRVGLTPKWYMSAYCKYLSDVIPQVLAHFAEEPKLGIDSCRALLKVILFDMSLALDTYFHAEHKALTQARSYTEQIVSNMPIGFIVTNPHGKIGLANNAVQRMFNKGRNDAWQDKTVGNYLDIEILDEEIDHVLKSGIPSNDFEFDRADGKIMRTYLADISMAKMGTENVVLIMVQDVTLRKQSEEAIHRLAFYDSLTHLGGVNK